VEFDDHPPPTRRTPTRAVASVVSKPALDDG
jgi:hypothetical protein